MAIHYENFNKKYRPRRFVDLRGQDILKKTLSYAVLNNRIAAGYLLTGSQGIGKTTTARIIAKSVNCQLISKPENYAAPCDKCQNCLSFNDDSHPDILEIDAASRTGVDDIRQIIDSSDYMPILGRYKLFIIDEVHMLSKGAFNALLKVLEEPPSHVIFIFATTEIHKIPETIISRCQCFNLSKLSVSELLIILKNIASKEHLKYEDEALNLIATQAQGSAREAVAYLDQAVRHGELLTSKTIHNILGLAKSDLLVQFLELLNNKHSDELFALIAEINKSSNIIKFLTQVTSFIAHLSKLKILGITKLDSIYTKSAERIDTLLNQMSEAYLSIIWQMFHQANTTIKTAASQLEVMEMLVIKVMFSRSIGMFKNMEIDTKSEEVAIDKINQQIEKILVPEADFYSFIKYLNKHNEQELRYLLMNEIEVKKFDDNVFELLVLDNLKDNKEQIERLLFEWTGHKWHVIVHKAEQVLSLKDKLIKQVKDSPQWQMITENFSHAIIADILLNDKI